MKRSDIVKMVRQGTAEDITNLSLQEAAVKLGTYQTVCVTTGLYGINAALFRNVLTNKTYAVLVRNTLLFELV